MSESTTQEKAVLNHLEKNDSISTYQAFKLFGVTRLASIIFNLRQDGHEIETHKGKVTSRYGNCTMYAIYKLKR